MCLCFARVCEFALKCMRAFARGCVCLRDCVYVCECACVRARVVGQWQTYRYDRVCHISRQKLVV